MREISNIPIEHNELSQMSDCKTIDNLLDTESRMKIQRDIDEATFMIDPLVQLQQ